MWREMNHQPHAHCAHDYKYETVRFHGLNREGFCIIETSDAIVHVAAYSCYFPSIFNRQPGAK